MFNVYLDTNVFYNDQRGHSTPFQIIETLAQREQLTIHLSEVTLKEFISQREATFDEAVRQIRRPLLKYIERMNAFREKESISKKILDKLKEDKKYIAEEFSQWIAKHNVQVSPVSDDHGSKVMTMYFDGDKAFKRPKNKEDFPDAFIYLSVLETASHLPNLHFVCGDNTLRSSCDAIENVKTYQNLEELTNSLSEEFGQITEKVPDDLQKLFFNRIKAQHGGLKLHIERMIGKTIHDKYSPFPISANDKYSPIPIPEEFSQVSASIYGEKEAYDLDINIDDFEDHGLGLITIPFTGHWNAIANFITGHNTSSTEWAKELLRNYRKEGLLSASLVSLSNISGELIYKVTGTLQFRIKPQALEKQSSFEKSLQQLGVIPGVVSSSDLILCKVEKINSLELLEKPEKMHT